MVNPYRFYTYAYLREDRTPYYIGKGKDSRAYRKYKGEVNPPKDKTRIIFLKQNLTEEEAFKHEKYMIAVFGRKDLRTGILHNKTNGGDGASGIIPWNKGKTGIFSKETILKISKASKGRKILLPRSEEWRKKQSEARKGEKHCFYGKSPSEETRKKLSEAKKGKNHPLYGKSHSDESKRKMSEANKNKKWWNDKCGNTKFCLECPGEGWFLGRK